MLWYVFCWIRLTQYDKVVHLDADTIIVNVSTINDDIDKSYHILSDLYIVLYGMVLCCMVLCCMVWYGMVCSLH